MLAGVERKVDRRKQAEERKKGSNVQPGVDALGYVKSTTPERLFSTSSFRVVSSPSFVSIVPPNPSRSISSPTLSPLPLELLELLAGAGVSSAFTSAFATAAAVFLVAAEAALPLEARGLETLLFSTGAGAGAGLRSRSVTGIMAGVGGVWWVAEAAGMRCDGRARGG